MHEPEEHAHVGTIDVMCGFGGALAIAAALYQKLKTGRSGRGRTSLSSNSGLLQIPFCYDYAGRSLFTEPSGRYVNGYDALTRFYHTASGEFLLLSGNEADVVRLDKLPDFEGFAAVPRDEREAFLTEIFSADTAQSWLEKLHAAGFGAVVCDNIDALRATYSREADGTPGTDEGSYSFSVYSDHPSGHVVTQLDPYSIRPTRSKVVALAPAEKFGASTVSVLNELGYTADQIKQMMEAGAVGESWSKEYLPS